MALAEECSPLSFSKPPGPCLRWDERPVIRQEAAGLTFHKPIRIPKRVAERGPHRPPGLGNGPG